MRHVFKFFVGNFAETPVSSLKRTGNGILDVNGHEHLCRAAFLYGTETLALTELQQQRLQVHVRKQLGPKNSKSNEGRQAKNGGVKGIDGSAEELDRETAW